MRTTPEPGPPGDCLEPDALLAFVEGRDRPSERLRVEGHVTGCVACRQVLSALAPSLEAAARPPASDVRTREAPAEGAPGAGLAPGARVGRFVVLVRVGAGGMGVVYSAYDPELNRTLALKLLRHDRSEGFSQRETEARLRREAQAMAKLAHPNVAAVYDVGRHEGRVFVAMEFVEGVTLAQWLRQKKRSRGQILEPFLAAGRGLAAAHAAGLVHRDVKPQNVLVGDDGRVRVVDFGLARAAGEAHASVAPRPEAPFSEAPFREAPTPEGAPSLTRTGALLGTPSYMAPEQLRGEAADASSDQFSFCVALYEALYGERPFAGETLRELGAAVEGGRVRAPPRGARVPGRLRRVLVRGLSAAPGARFPSMDALLGELAREPARRLRRAAFATAAALVMAAGGALVAHRIGERRLLCQGAERHLEQVWDATRRREVEAALLRTGAPFAEAAAREVSRVLDGYAARWAAQHIEACEATRVRGEQTEALMGLRMACLDDRRLELKALGQQLLGADRDVAERAGQAVHRLSDLEACANVRSLTSPLRPPTDAATRAAVDGVRAGLAEARALSLAGRYREGLEAARPLGERARQLRYRPLEAEALLLVGEMADETGSYEEAGRSLEQAAWAAEAGRHDEAAVRALVATIWVEGYHQARYERVGALSQRVTALLERLGGPGELEAHLLVTVGAVDLQRSRFAEAERGLERALALLEPKSGADDPRLAETLATLGRLAYYQEQTPKARAYFERSLAVCRRTFGDEHPKVADALVNIASIQHDTYEYALAEASFRQALAVLERALGPQHAKVANVMNGLALSYVGQGRHDEAIALQRRVIAIDEAALGTEHPYHAVHLTALAATLEAAGEWAEALALLERALVQLRARFGDEHTRVAEALHILGRTKAKLGRLAEALQVMEQSHAMNRRALGDDYRAGEVLQGLGEVYLRQRRPVQAVEALESALRSHRQYEDEPLTVAQTNALLARALWELGRDRSRARTLALEAHALLAESPRAAAEFADLERWMRARSVR